MEISPERPLVRKQSIRRRKPRFILPQTLLSSDTKEEISSGEACLLLADSSDLPHSVPNDDRASPSLAGVAADTLAWTDGSGHHGPWGTFTP